MVRSVAGRASARLLKLEICQNGKFSQVPARSILMTQCKKDRRYRRLRINSKRSAFAARQPAVSAEGRCVVLAMMEQH
jgi:hypothetical protein